MERLIWKGVVKVVGFGLGVSRRPSHQDEYVLVLTSANQVLTASADAMPFVGPMPGKDGHYVCAGFHGHGEEGIRSFHLLLRVFTRN